MKGLGALVFMCAENKSKYLMEVATVKVRCTKISIPGRMAVRAINAFGQFRAQRAPLPYNI